MGGDESTVCRMMMLKLLLVLPVSLARLGQSLLRGSMLRRTDSLSADVSFRLLQLLLRLCSAALVVAMKMMSGGVDCETGQIVSKGSSGQRND